MVITLTGFMGCGKSSVGKALAERLGWEFVDLDAYIEHKKGMSVADIFSNEGEEAFRALEAECLRDVIVMRQIAGGDVVLALGGGTMTITSVQWLIREQTECFWLKASLETCLGRIGADRSDRPLLGTSITSGAPADKLELLFKEREKYYSLAAHYIDTEGKTIEETVEDILAYRTVI